jgi:hypothetical protein
MKAVSVTTIPGYKLQVTFDDGVAGVIDLKDFIETGIFSGLKDEKLFSKAYTTGYSIAWNEDLEIDVVAIYAEITHKKPGDILAANLSYATN